MSYFLIGIWLAVALSIVCFLAWEIIYTKGLWYMKILSTSLVVFLIFFSIYTWREIQGSPRFVKNPEGLIVRSYMIKEPKQNDKGKIWLWVNYPNNKEEPFNVEIPYSKQTHKNLMQNKGLSEGRAQVIKKHKKQNMDNADSDKHYIFEDVQKLIQKNS